MKIREKISAIYWGAVDRIGPLVPTPQVVGSALAGVVVQFLQTEGIDLSPFGVTPGFISVAAVALVAYLIGPERDKEGRRLKSQRDVPVVITEPDDNVVAFDKPPKIEGEWVGPEDDPNAPGTGLVG